MSDSEISLIVDQGNTTTKIALFNKNEVEKKMIIDSFDQHVWDDLINEHAPFQSIFASVAKDAPGWMLKESRTNVVVLNEQTPLPFKSDYKTMHTLGVDRIANAAAVVTEGKYPTLIIDAGSCITYDVINDKGVFIGGSISPGINMRFKAMNKFTGRLPFIEKIKIKNPLIGETTEASMISGVLHGIKGEMQRYISLLTEEYSDLTIFLTGGDLSYFDLEAKNDIFANPNLTLTGLFKILKLNAKG